MDSRDHLSDLELAQEEATTANARVRLAEWGDKGYGWLPYEYVLKELAEDWWTLIDSKWVDTGEFKI